MGVTLRCKCGNDVYCDDQLAGRRVRCPACGRELLVPGGEPAGRRADWGDEDDRPERAGPVRTSGKAIASLVLGIFSVGCSFLTGLPALILGLLALGDIGRSNGRVQGSGLAVAGIVTGVVGTLLSIPLILMALLIPAVQKVREAAARTQSSNNLKEIGLAQLNYADATGHLPAQAIYSKDGKPLLSWRVAILPYIEQQGLYLQFHLDEPWDSPHNKPLLAQMPKTYLLPGDPQGTTETHYLAFVGPGAFFEGKQGLRFPGDFPDGSSQTIMAVEAAQGVPWTKPEDLPFDPDKPLPKLGGHFAGGFNVLMCDSSVRFVSDKTSEKTLNAAVTRNGGEILGPDW